jgi:hypothetical protein
MSPSSTPPNVSFNVGTIARGQFSHHSQVWAESQLKIKDKGGSIIPLSYNYPQKDLERTFHEGMAKREPVRIIILKARQIGCSTWTESVIYDWICNIANQDALILADAPKSSQRLYEMFTTFYDHHIGRRKTRHMHAKGLKFAQPHNSQVVVDTAKRKYAGTSLTVQCAHLSEVAKWDDPETTMLSLMQALPGRADTFAVMESTAAGAGDWFNEQWDAAANGESEWTARFYPWFDMPEYRINPQRVNMENMGKDDRFNLYQGEETDLLKQFKRRISKEQMAWRRWAINNNCGGDVLLFHQEYPSSPEEAFISAGSPRFSVPVLAQWRQDATDPIRRGSFPVVFTYTDVTGKIQEGDLVHIWEMPILGHDYVIGADSAGSDPRGDFNAAVVIDKTTVPYRVVAKVHGWTDADVYASQLAGLGRLYNNALLAIEVNGIGEAVQNQARHIYHNFYHRIPIDKQVRMPGDRIGWYTGQITRHNIIETLAAAIRDQEVFVPSADIILEMLSFHVVPGKRGAESKPGTHDDYIFALGIALCTAQYTVSGEYRHYSPEEHESVGVQYAEDAA